MKKNKGFTLVELLAVITILGIIIIIAIPAALNLLVNLKINLMNILKRILSIQQECILWILLKK